MLEANQSVGRSAVSLYSASRVCLRWWQGVNKMNPVNPRAISVHHCRFSSWVTLVLSREGAGAVLGPVRPCSPLTQSVRKLEATFELAGLSGKDFSVMDELGALGRGNRQEGPPNSLGWMLVLPCDG